MPLIQMSQPSKTISALQMPVGERKIISDERHRWGKRAITGRVVTRGQHHWRLRIRRGNGGKNAR
ncbi:MAG: hypothetical protein WBP18_12310 [Paracoccaceae bacterium]